MKVFASLAAAPLIASPAAVVSQAGTPGRQATPQDPAGRLAPVGDRQGLADKAASGNMFEIESGRLAVDKVQGQAVAEIARLMIADPMKAGEDMKAAAGQEGAAVPDRRARPEQEMLAALKASEDFRETCPADPVKGHDHTVALFESHIANGPDRAQRACASKTLPTLKDHQQKIHTVAST
jgi:putative membrane protein